MTLIICFHARYMVAYFRAVQTGNALAAELREAHDAFQTEASRLEKIAAQARLLLCRSRCSRFSLIYFYLFFPFFHTVLAVAAHCGRRTTRRASRARGAGTGRPSRGMCTPRLLLPDCP